MININFFIFTVKKTKQVSEVGEAVEDEDYELDEDMKEEAMTGS